MKVDPDSIPPELAGRFRSRLVLKQDVFSTVERGTFSTAEGEVEAVLRRIDLVPWWSAPIARHFLKREARGISVAGGMGVAPSLLYLGQQALVRSWVDGLPMQLAKPEGDGQYFRSARRALRSIHRECLTHNDLAKEQNWLRTPTGYASLTDFQLATRFSKRSTMFRLAAYEDLRHMLKHKRRYAPDFLTASEQRILARKTWPTRIWMATGKKVYYWITRGLLNFTDREGSGPRFVNDAPRLTARLKEVAGVRDAVIVAFPDRRTGTGLYAFVEGDRVTEQDLLKFLTDHPEKVAEPERLQVVERLPRGKAGDIRTDILQLVAMNQIDLIDPLIGSESEKEVVARIVAGRQNLRDRFAF
ncbi:MAG: serine/threonine protein kinase [Pseudorhodoplanes sp.]